MDCVQKSNFLLSLFVTEIMSEKNRFSIFWIENNHFNTKKLKFQKGRKNGHFLRGLVHGFCPKIELFLFSVFHRNHITKDRFLISWKEKNNFKRKKLKFYDFNYVSKDRFWIF